MRSGASTVGEIASLSRVVEAVQNARSEGRQVILTNGAFDLLHVGHVRYLQGARALDPQALLVVAVNSDRSVQNSKGQDRPWVPENERAELVAALSGIDWVVLFSDERVDKVVTALQPDIQAKGTDYRHDTIPEKEIVEAYGGKVAIVGDPKNHSTTEMVEALKD
jgi:D-glycero-beta-D-manno-heptose 1-phosphate adenylyltransferase